VFQSRPSGCWMYASKSWMRVNGNGTSRGCSFCTPSDTGSRMMTPFCWAYLRRLSFFLTSWPRILKRHSCSLTFHDNVILSNNKSKMVEILLLLWFFRLFCLPSSPYLSQIRYAYFNGKPLMADLLLLFDKSTPIPHTCPSFAFPSPRRCLHPSRTPIPA
jgi:hypothetical protein